MRPLSAQEAWNANADYWDEKVGEGNVYQIKLIAPAMERYLGEVRGQRVLELACGNGLFARRLAELGAIVIATDFSEGMLTTARKRSPGHTSLEYQLLDATSPAQLDAIGTFDAVVCGMGLMDMETITPLAAALPRMLRAGGRFGFSILHPCFANPSTVRFTEEAPFARASEPHHGVRITRYLTSFTQPGVALAGQPVDHPYFHRPLSAVLRPFFDAGLALDGLEEPAFPAPTPGTLADLARRRLSEIPTVLVGRLRPTAPTT